ncbi:hypothetical protein IAG41_16235 [Sphingomonas sp. JC676]|nr:hypothetical protein [Sphingomonas sp. JC676]
MAAHRPRMDEALRLIDGRTVGESDDGPDARSRHQPPTDGIVTDDIEQHLVQPGELLPHDAPDGQQWLDNDGQSRQPLDQLTDTRLEPGIANHADLQAEVAQRAAQIGIDIKHLALNQLARGQQHPLLLARQSLDVHRLEQADTHHLGDAARIVPVGLVDLLRLQQRLHVPGLNADHGQARIRLRPRAPSTLPHLGAHGAYMGVPSLFIPR